MSRGESFPTRTPFQDYGADRELALQRRLAFERAQRAAAEALRLLRARRIRSQRTKPDPGSLEGTAPVSSSSGQVSHDEKEKPQPKNQFYDEHLFDDLPYVAEIREARQLSKDHWQGIDVATGELLDVRGGAMPKRLLAIRGHTPVGLIYVTPVGHEPHFRR